MWRPICSLVAAILLLVGCTDPDPPTSLVDGNTAVVVSVVPEPGSCVRWVATSGDDDASGGRDDPWATPAHAIEAVPDDGCTVFVADGVYEGSTSIDRAFTTTTVLRAVNDHMARLLSDGSAIDIGTEASNLIIAGFELTQTGPEAEGPLVYVSGTEDGAQAPNRIAFVNDVFHDAWGDDLLKIRSGAREISVAGNIFANQSDRAQGEQHIDVNSASDVAIVDNVFFNDFEAAGRPDVRISQHFIVVKDSNGDADGQLGSRRVTIERNVFTHFQGDRSSLIAIGNDGEPFHEAVDVLIRNNLIVGDGPDEVYTALSIYGAKDVSFVHNTVVGDLPSSSFAVVIGTKGDNPPNENVVLANTIWADPTGTMGSFSDGDPDGTRGLLLTRNLYWNAGSPVEPGELIGPDDDAGAVLEDPGLPVDQGDVALPWWDGTSFTSGDATIRDAFERLVAAYGAIVATSPAAGQADAAYSPPTDILGRPRDGTPDLGAFEETA